MTEQSIATLSAASPDAVLEAALALDLIAWCKSTRWEVRPGVEYEFDEDPWIDEIYTLEAREKVIMKAAQVRVSEYLISEAFWKMDTEGWNVFYAFPTSTKVSQFVKGRVDTALDASPYLRRHLRTDDVFTKRVKNGIIYFSGAQDPEQLVSCSVDIVIRDEYELIPLSTMDLIPKRYGDSRHKWLRDASHPRYTKDGIHARFLQSDQREWEVPCPHCETWNELTWDLVKFSEETARLCDVGAFDKIGSDDIEVTCRKYGKPVDRLANGRWVPRNPKSGVAGWHVSKLMSSRASLPELVQSSRKRTEVEIAAFWNMDMGLPYSPKGAGVTRETLDRNLRSEYYLPKSADDTVFGVDVGAKYHVIGGRFVDDEVVPVFIGTADDLSEVRDILKQFGSRMCIVDSMPEIHDAKRFAKSSKRIALANFNGMDSSVDLLKLRPITEDGIRTISINRNQICDEVERSFSDDRYHLPADANRIPDFYNHMQANKRIVDEVRGKTIVKWENGNKPDHYFFANAYMFAAHFLLMKLGYRKKRKISQRTVSSIPGMGLSSTREDLG